MAFLDTTIVNVALPFVQADLGATAAQAQWVYGAFALVLAALMLVGGSLGDHYGRRRAFSLGLLLFGGASAGAALAPDAGWLVAARAAQGVGGALMVPASLAILGAAFDGARRARAIGIWAALSGLAMAVGPVLGGVLVENVSWRAAFLVTPVLAVGALAITVRHVPESYDPEASRLDFLGAALVTAGLGGVSYGLIHSQATGFGSASVLAPLALGAAALAAFVLVERRGSEPMVPPALFRSRAFDGATLYTLLFYAALTGSLYFLPFLLVQVHGYSATAAGTVFLPFVTAALVLGRFSGRIVCRFGVKGPLVVAALTTGAGYLLFALPDAQGASYWTAFFPAMVVQGFGMALAIAPLTAAALGSVAGEHEGLASGINNAVCRMAGLLSVAAFGLLVFAYFSMSLDARVEDLALAPESRAALETEKAKLGAAQIPEGLDAATGTRIKEAIEESFVAGFRLVMLVSAALALASAAVAALFLGDEGAGSPGRGSRAFPGHVPARPPARAGRKREKGAGVSGGRYGPPAPVRFAAWGKLLVLCACRRLREDGYVLFPMARRQERYENSLEGGTR